MDACQAPQAGLFGTANIDFMIPNLAPMTLTATSPRQSIATSLLIPPPCIVDQTGTVSAS
jgi:hypothetical protein